MKHKNYRVIAVVALTTLSGAFASGQDLMKEAAGGSGLSGLATLSWFDYDHEFFEGDVQVGSLILTGEIGDYSTQLDLMVGNLSGVNDQRINFAGHIGKQYENSFFGVFVGAENYSGPTGFFAGIEGDYAFSEKLNVEWHIGVLDYANNIEVDEFAGIEVTYKFTDNFYATCRAFELNLENLSLDNIDYGVGYQFSNGIGVEATAGRSFEADTFGFSLSYNFGDGLPVYNGRGLMPILSR